VAGAIQCRTCPESPHAATVWITITHYSQSPCVAIESSFKQGVAPAATRVSDVLSGLIHCGGVVIDTQSDVSPSRQRMAMLANGLIRQAATCHQHAR
jgi:hypothetical protein